MAAQGAVVVVQYRSPDDLPIPILQCWFSLLCLLFFDYLGNTWRIDTFLKWENIVLEWHREATVICNPPKAAQAPGMQRGIIFFIKHCNSVKMVQTAFEKGKPEEWKQLISHWFSGTWLHSFACMHWYCDMFLDLNDWTSPFRADGIEVSGLDHSW